MEILDLGDAYVGTYCKCLEDWSEEMKDAGDHHFDALPKSLTNRAGAAVIAS